MNTFENLIFSKERELYLTTNTTINHCYFIPLNIDGESPLKESSDITVVDCEFSLRYALWHVDHANIINSTFTSLCRAPFWYDEHIHFDNSVINSPKALRESNDILCNNCKIESEEFAWRCNFLELHECSLNGFYAFFNSKKIIIDRLTFKGKYSFQYIENLSLSNSKLDTKDAFWHTKNAIIRDCEINGEYIGWYSENLTFINCKIKGTQPFCYCKKLKLINCELVEADFAFEYSDVEADLIGEIISIKNPKSGYIKIPSVKEIINTKSKYKVACEIIIKH